MTKLRTAPYDIPGLGLVPAIHVETWGVFEAFRRLGFKNEELELLVAGNIDTGVLRKNVLHVVLKSQGLRFTYTILPIEQPFAEFKDLFTSLILAINEYKIPDDRLLEMYRETDIGAVDGQRFTTLIALLMAKGFRVRKLEN